jgi:Domain of unknown function (DUF1844).
VLLSAEDGLAHGQETRQRTAESHRQTALHSRGRNPGGVPRVGEAGRARRRATTISDNEAKPEPKSERKKKLRDAAENPGTPFTNLVEMLVMNGYVSLGLLRAPHQPPMKPDLAAARQMIDWISMLAEKTKGNLTEDEEDFLQLHLSDLKLKFVQLSRSL